MKKLSNNVQSLIGASLYVRTFKTAIEELVYNSLDAKSTSIAIRVNIQENFIQVIDNGHGIPECDFDLLGQKHATSKFIDVATLKSEPCKYGFRGQALAGIIEISKHVKITSRCEQSEETWVKHFHQGKVKDTSAAARRPSKGTTIDIRGFLFNLKIQQKAIDPLKELCDIKRFLEQLSLVHINISLSLRDDAKNEIVFKIHKNRELFQTLSTLYGINKDNLQELHIEKNKYKVTAYIEKLDQELMKQNWIYLNGKFISDSKLHKIVNNLFSKKLSTQTRGAKRMKSNYNDEDKDLFKKKIPFYILFISCPYYDYDVNISNSETHLEFKSWDSIKNLLNKLIMFYAGDVKLKPLNTETNSSKAQHNTREEVKKIMNKILGSHNNKLRVSQMQNGIKGRFITRKSKKKLVNRSKQKVKEVTPDPIPTVDTALKEKPALPTPKTLKDQIVSVKLRSNQNLSPADSTEAINEINKDQSLQKCKTGKHKKQILSKSKNRTKNTRNNNGAKNKKVKRKHVYNKNPIIRRFKNEDEQIKRNCNMLSKKVEKALLPKKQTKQIFVNETVQYSNIVRNNKNISVRQKIEEIVIHEYLPKKSRGLSKNHNADNKIAKYNPKSNYDLINTVLKTQQDNKANVYFDEMIVNNNRENKTPAQHLNNVVNSPYITNLNQSNDVILPLLTYESHRYQELNSHYQDNTVEKSRNNEFISKQSIENFKLPGYNLKMNSMKKLFSASKHKPYFKKPQTILHRIFNNEKFSLSSYDIDFSQNIEKQAEKLFVSQTDVASFKNVHSTYTFDGYDSVETIPFTVSSIIGNTYTLTSSVNNGTVHNSKLSNNILTGHDNFETFTINNVYDNKDNPNKDPSELEPKNDFDVIFLSKPQNEDIIADTSIEPLDICATVMESNDILNEEFRISFNDNIVHNDSLLNIQTYNDNTNNIEEISSHWQNINKNCINTVNDNLVREVTDINKTSPIIQCNINKKCDQQNRNESNWETNHYNFKNRPRFLPKGMSPIFENSKSKTACQNFIDEECFADKIYDNFANEVQTNTEMFGFGVHNATEITTKDIEKVNTKMHKDNASLIFDSGSLKTLQVMGQVDEKFIAAKIKGKTNDTQTATEFLVLFDQHAVHERVKLEKNMEDYFHNDKWRSVEVDGVLLKLSKDQILYLHNYEDKFTQFGLKWTILDSEEIIINAIPEAVLGKNPRQVDKVLKAVKNLISEEIETINNQKGCISLLPKAIMELIFSESCRYAIKFGDRLSKGSCVELLQDLAKCKTPFQCAHGRPVMAVLMEIESKKHDYKINMNKVNSFIKK